jgi:hypothetical protein
MDRFYSRRMLARSAVVLVLIIIVETIRGEMEVGSGGGRRWRKRRKKDVEIDVIIDFQFIWCSPSTVLSHALSIASSLARVRNE